MRIKVMSLFLIWLPTVFIIASGALAQKPAEQVSIGLVNYMPNHPYPYKMKDWKEITRKQDALLFDFDARGYLLPLIWWDDQQVNFPERSFGIVSYVGQSKGLGGSGESLPAMGAVLGASLIGIDKSSQDGVDYVSMLKKFFNKANGANSFQNSSSRMPGSTFWYEIWPGMAFSMIVHSYPGLPELAALMKANAESWMVTIEGLKQGRPYPDFNYTSFDFESNTGFFNGRWKEPDAAAGLAWTTYMAWEKFGEEKFLDAAKDCMNFLEARAAQEGTFYEIMMPYGAYLAVRMNAELGTHFDELKMLNWCFDGNNSYRDGWGVMAERWGKYDVHGLVGQKKWEQYAFAMNTFSHAAALTPIVKYNPSYAKTIGKWMLNLANASRLFYPDEHPRNRQTSAYWQGDPDHVIAYEGVRKNLDKGNLFHVFKGVLTDEGPYGVGDQMKRQNSMTDICPYGSAWVGMFAAIVDTTNVKKILKLDCNATDFFGNNDFPSYLFFNPYYETMTVAIDAGETPVTIYDLVSKETLASHVTGNVSIEISGDQARVIKLIPSDLRIRARGNRLFAGDIIVDYAYR